MRKLNVSIVVGVVIAVLGAGIVVAYGQSVDKRIASGKNPVAVLVADADFDAGTPANDLTSRVHVEKVPSAYVAAGALKSVEALRSVSKDYVLTGPVTRGAQLTARSFADAATAGHVKPSPGNVAISVQTDLSPGVARYLAVGSNVDVFATYRDVRNEKGKLTPASSRTKLFVSNVRVLAVSVAQVPDGGSANESDLTDKVVALLDLSPADAERLVNATTLGQIYLAETTSGQHTTPTGANPDSVIASNR